MTIEKHDLIPLIAKRRTIDQMAEELGATRSAVRWALHRHELKSPNKRGRRPLELDGTEWEPIGACSLQGLCFTDAKVPASIGFRHPHIEERESLVGCGTEMCSA